MAIELATAYVSIVPETKNFEKELKRQLRGGDVKVGVDADTKGASSNVSRWRSAEERNHVNIRVDADTRGASSQLRGLRRDMESLGRSDLLRINVGAAGIASLPALATGLAQVAAAMQQVAQAGLALPGVFAGAASSVGTLLFGVSGVKDAFDALGKAQDDAATSGGDLASSARAQQSASNSLRNAVVDEAQARKDVARATRDARNELVDLNIEQRGGIISEKRAVLEAQRAREELMSGNFTDLRDQLLRVEEADQRVLETRARNAETAEQLNDANAKGVAGSDQVVAANERLTRSQQAVADANSAVAAAAPQASAAQDAANLAMSKLSPAGQEFAQTLRDLVDGPGMELRNMLGDKILGGLSDRLTDLADKAMPTVENGLGGIADAWNNTFNEIFDVLGEDDSMSFLERIFGNTEEAQNILTGAIDPLVEGIGTLTAAGSDALPRLADAFVTVSNRFADFITEADRNGSLKTWIDEGITAMGHLFEISLNVGKMFTAITGATDGSFLENLERWTTKWQEWLNSVEGQDTLKNFFAEGKRIWEEWKPILEDLPNIFRGIYDAVSAHTSALIEVLKPITWILSEIPGAAELATAGIMLMSGATVLQSIKKLHTALFGVNTMLATTIPESSVKAKTSLTSNLIGPGAAVIAGSWGIGEIQEQLDTLFGTNFFSKYGNLPGSAAWLLNGGLSTLDFKVPDWLKDNSPNPGITGTTVGQGPGATATQGDALDPGFFLGAGGDAREFAHGSMMPFWEKQGFTVGDHAADQFGEHQNGALDIMVDSLQEGQKVLEEALKDPNVYGAIFNNQTFGYGHGATPQDYSAGHTGNPTQDHQDHVHVWYKPGNGDNIAPMPAAPPTHPALPSQPGQPTPPPGPPGSPVDDFWRRTLGPQRTFDTGGWWPSGTTGINTTGKPEYVLKPEDIEWLKKNGIDPASVQQIAAGQQPPGPPQGTPGMAPDAKVDLSQYQYGAKPGDITAAGRTEGYIPAAAGNTGKTGGGVAGSLINLGSEAIQGVIQTAADAGKMAASMGSMGAGGQAAGAGIQIGADMAKRGVQYGAEMLSIGVGALTEQLFPFGAPRWLSDVDATGFMPQLGITPATTTTSEAAIQAIQQQNMPTDHGMGGPAGPQQPQMPAPPGMDFLGRAVQQMPEPQAPPPPPPPVHIENMNTSDPNAVGASIAKQQRLAAMQYAGRP